MTIPFLGRRPWLLVWAAFVLLIAVWVVAFWASGRASSEILTPAQEEALLRQHSQP